jgi:hypothetical protein
LDSNEGYILESSKWFSKSYFRAERMKTFLVNGYPAKICNIKFCMFNAGCVCFNTEFKYKICGIRKNIIDRKEKSQ